MSSLEKPDLVPTNVKWRWPSVHPEGRKFVVIAATLTLVLWFVLGWDIVGWLSVGLAIWTAAFFRDPIRTTPATDGLVISPADGLVTMITNLPPPRELQGEGALTADPVVRVSIFMSVFDVHINRTRSPARSRASLILPASSSTPISTRRARTMNASIY
jgi:phosphatidylserine decarboxylase